MQKEKNKTHRKFMNKTIIYFDIDNKNKILKCLTISICSDTRKLRGRGGHAENLRGDPSDEI